MQSLYPSIQPYSQQFIEVDETHTLYVEQSGNPVGLPVVFLHGGPGAGCEPLYRRFFDPERYRIILFDQRGCGQSTPHAELTANTTWLLVDDMETIRQTLGVEQWVLFGGSWGSTLALAYAETHAKRVFGMIVRGIFLLRPEDLHWFYQSGANRLFPDHWEQFVAPIPESERGDIIRAYYQRLTGSDELERLRLARTWAGWEGATLTLERNAQLVDSFTEAHRALSLARIEAYYFINQGFLKPGQLLQQADRLAGIPGYIVHGRYDVITPLDNAWALAQAWPDAELRIVGAAGHSVAEPGIIDALVTATRRLVEQVA
jgi:proline iminopeptidase